MSFSSNVRKEVASLTGGTGRRTYIRQCFVTGGTITDPVKAYHLAFTLPDPEAEKLTNILTGFGLHPKTLAKNGHTIVYLKEAEEISDVLKMMDAHKSLLEYEGKRVEKELRNSLNRQVNCEAANLSKTVTAAQGQIEAIKFIVREAGLGSLSKPLQDIARLRIAHDTASLAEIGAMLSPPIGKSGVNHRLRKIVEIADEMKGFNI
ncbi:MAG: DNA-binding protein WhiA [Defluviitaleaceae bacterium]|nr:DNA-binding protein WhiA [Defluviitaleaceae bacterium]